MRKLSNDELGRKTPEEFKLSEKTPLILVLDNVRSLNNVGSVFRTADSFLLEAVYLCGITGTPPHKDIQKTALGATDTVTWKYFNQTIDAVNELKGINYDVYAIEQAENSIKLHEFKTNASKKLAFILGNEINGVDQNIINQCHGVIEIPQTGFKHSLNISIAAGIVCWEIYRQLI
ncbi:MAG TPA: RNA methyltransferase [Bacteroidia bacterium]|nr:RNA methyltransferase [Bacteroidia bacterium]